MREHPGIGRVLVAVKPDERGLPLAASHARFLAQALNAEIRLVSCVFDSVVDSALPGGDPAAEQMRSRLIESEQAELDGLAQSLRDWGATVTAHARWDAPAHQGILREADEWQADLLVAGAHAPIPILRTRLVDTDWQLMRLCPCPLLLVKNPELAEYRQVLAAVDPLHQHAEPAGLDRRVLEMAGSLSDAFGASLDVVNAHPNPRDYEVVSSIEILPGVFYGAENIEELHRAAVDDLLGEARVTDAHVELRAGTPADVIAEVAGERKTDLVVLGALKRSRWQAGVLGTTAEAVAEQVDCDVLLVKPRG